MDAETLDRLRHNLAELRERVLGGLANLQQDALSRSPREQSGDLSGYSIHQADTATDAYDRELSLSIASREQEILNDIDDALAKMEAGSYGMCERCGDAIGERRLAAVPHARLCLPCKERQERGAGG
ncbi:MAG: TraR/DksA family transcriptional regulator [bacterium]|nr:TraR/DksA family transcriptional regulator [bacterium]